MSLYRVLLLLALTILSYHFGISQDVMSGCVSIDFEAINGEPVFEGMEISDQYFEEFGLTFTLEDGTSPVIARVGFPTTAFGSSEGNDTPAAGVDIGQFFLTDDGILDGLSSPPLILTFINPLDSIAGCILDIDFDEEFIMHARDIDDVVILADTIRAGDPGTGDGALSCWGFNLEGCEGAIYSLRMEGTRQSLGAFGLGVDYLSFCLSGIDLIKDIVPIVQNTYCDLENGSITLTNVLGTPLTYSIDGINFQESPVFENLPAGSFTIYVMNAEGCTGQLDLPIFVDEPLNTDDLIINDTTCGEDNGILVSMSPDENSSMYSIDGGVSFQNSQTFTNLPPGDYILTKVDQYGCDYFEPFTIEPSLTPSFELVGFSDESCLLANGEIEVLGTPSLGVASYSINSGSLQLDPLFTNLSEGDYTVTMIDEDNCILSLDIGLENGNHVILDGYEIEDATCEIREGSIEVFASGGIGELLYSIDSTDYQPNNLFVSVEAGFHTIEIQDEEGCIVREIIEIVIPDCPVFIPNIFCPTCGNGENSTFFINTTRLYDIQIIRFEIYDRWGNLIFKAGQESIHSKGIYWDGMFGDRPAEIGVYAYRIEVLHENGEPVVFHGDITLVR